MKLTGLLQRLHQYVADLPSTRHLAQSVYPGTNLPTRLNQYKFRLRALVYYRHHLQMKAVLGADPLMRIERDNPRIFLKIYRQYLYYGASVDKRLQILKSNYRFLGSVFDSTQIDAIFTHRDFTISRIDLPNGGGQVVARLTYDSRFETEGELTLGLYDQSGRRLYSLSFTFNVSGEKSEAVIGCLIGPDQTGLSSEEQVLTAKELTKGMHGMRPQNLVVYLLQALCRHLGVRNIVAVGSRSHVNSRSARKRMRIKFDYKLFWEECGGEAQGNYHALPLQHPRRSVDEIRSNKRASYARRYAFLDDLDMQLHKELTTQGSGRVVAEQQFPAIPAAELDRSSESPNRPLHLAA